TAGAPAAGCVARLGVARIRALSACASASRTSGVARRLWAAQLGHPPPHGQPIGGLGPLPGTRADAGARDGGAVESCDLAACARAATIVAVRTEFPRYSRLTQPAGPQANATKRPTGRLALNERAVRLERTTVASMVAPSSPRKGRLMRFTARLGRR